jgi:hypothetical protein
MTDQPQTTPLDTIQTKWVMQCCDGCALTFWDTEDAAVSAFRGHRAIGHHAILLAPGIIPYEQELRLAASRLNEALALVRECRSELRAATRAFYDANPDLPVPE